MTQEALKLALEALENGDVPTPENAGKNLDAITAIKEALAQKQEPVPPPWWTAVENILNEYGLQAIDFVADFKQALAQKQEPIAMLFGSLPVYDRTTPPQRTWAGLTDEEENEYNYLGPDMHWVIQEIAAKLKEKNT